jgi:hypothetical protein
MAATMITNVTLGRKMAVPISLCEPIGAYILIVTSERPEGGHATFHCACNFDGESKVRRIVYVPGSQGETLSLEWPEGNSPVLWYDDPMMAPVEELVYHVKIL